MIEQYLNFAPKALPALEQGKYKIEVSQETNIDNCKIESACLDFHVKTDRVSMSVGEVYSVYPPKDSCGTFGNCLPHIVLHRRTLPWECVVREEGTPWLALLVISEDENAKAATMKYSQSCITEEGTLIPKLTNTEEIDPDQTCKTITISYDLFSDILPTGEDLPYLAHVRGVNLDNKVTDSEVKGEWFSCIIGNRYPLASKSDDVRIQHTVYLVSLEGFGDYIYSAEMRQKDASTYQRVRMYCMYSWSFQVKSNAGFDFYNLSRRLEADTLQAGFDVRDESVNKLLKLGYVPMNHYFREGSSSISWYHSPFVPQKPQWNDIETAHFLSDKLLEYDPQNGMFNISYSAAWQIGRLMALGDKDFSRKLLAWRLSIKSQAIHNQTYKLLTEKVSNLRTYTYVDKLEENIEKLCREVWQNGVEQLINICGKANETTETASVKKIVKDTLKHNVLTQEDILYLGR